jgi:hypothetical protein
MGSNSSQEVAVLLPLVIGLMTTLATILVHACALAAILAFVRLEYRLGRAGVRYWRDLGIVAGVTLVALIAHLAEIALWAVVLALCREFARLATALYHSAVNYSSLGYGDIVMSNAWKLLGPLEAADGMLMFGVSTAMIFAVTQRLVQTRLGPSPLYEQDQPGQRGANHSPPDERSNAPSGLIDVLASSPVGSRYR